MFYIDNVWSSTLLDLNYQGPKNNKGCRFTLVVIHKVSKFGSTAPLNYKKAQTVRDYIESILTLLKEDENQSSLIMEMNLQTMFY